MSRNKSIEALMNFGSVFECYHVDKVKRLITIERYATTTAPLKYVSIEIKLPNKGK